MGLIHYREGLIFNLNTQVDKRQCIQALVNGSDGRTHLSLRLDKDKELNVLSNTLRHTLTRTHRQVHRTGCKQQTSGVGKGHSQAFYVSTNETSLAKQSGLGFLFLPFSGDDYFPPPKRPHMMLCVFTGCLLCFEKLHVPGRTSKRRPLRSAKHLIG